MLIREFCTKKLNEEYLELAERLVLKLARRRNVPFVTGQPQIWAAGIIHAIGTITFLFDKSSKPYIFVNDINDFFGTNVSTTGSKSKQIRDMLKIREFNAEFSTMKMMNSNPFQNYVMVDGFIVPLKLLPEDYQENVRLTRAEGKDISLRIK